MAQSKTKATRLSPKEKRAAQAAADRKARMQWMIIGAVLTIAVIAAIVLVSIFTEGSIPTNDFNSDIR